jgi:hypothetical protein
MNPEKKPHLLTLEKSSLDYLNTLLDSCKNAGIVILGSAAVLFYLFPAVHISFRDMMGEARWYFVGTFYKNKDPKSGLPQKGRFRWTDLNLGHYHNFYLGNSYNRDTGEIAPGTVLMVEADVAAGRVETKKIEDPLHWQIKQISKKNECIYVLNCRPIAVAQPKHGAAMERLIWVRALPQPC